MPTGKPPRPRTLPAAEGKLPKPTAFLPAAAPPRCTGGGMDPRASCVAEPICEGVTKDALDPVAGVTKPFCPCAASWQIRTFWWVLMVFNLLFAQGPAENWDFQGKH